MHSRVHSRSHTSIARKRQGRLTNASVNSGSWHACVTNSPRKLLLSEMTEHKVMTAVVPLNSIQQFRAVLFRAPRSLSLPLMLALIRSPRFLVIVSVQFHLQLQREIAPMSRAFFRSSLPPLLSSTTFPRDAKNVARRGSVEI